MINQEQQNQGLRFIPLLTGVVGGLLLLVNRLTTSTLLASQARSDVVGVILAAVLILIGLIWQRIQPQLPETVKLIGEEGLEMAFDLPDAVKTELAWATHLLLTNTVTGSIVIYYQGKVILRRGVLGANARVKPGKILERVLQQHKPLYLVDLKLYPGKIEFDYLPENTQGIICQPIGVEGVLILGAIAPRSYTKQDEQWIQAIADKLALTLST